MKIKLVLKDIRDRKIWDNAMHTIERVKKWPALKRPAQAQDSVTDQLERLVLLANKHGLYDAADWLEKVRPKQSDV